MTLPRVAPPADIRPNFKQLQDGYKDEMTTHQFVLLCVVAALCSFVGFTVGYFLVDFITQ